MRNKPNTRNVSVFATPAPPTKGQRDTQAWRRRIQELAEQLGMPHRMARHISHTAKSKQRAMDVAAQYKQGCHLTGLSFADKYHPKENAAPNAAVLRKDGTMVSYAIWVFSQEGVVSDAVLRNVSSAICAHAARPTPAHTPAAPRPPQPSTPPQEPAYANPTLALLGADDQDYGHPSEPYGRGEPAELGPSVLAWDESAQAVVRTPI